MNLVNYKSRYYVEKNRNLELLGEIEKLKLEVKRLKNKITRLEKSDVKDEVGK